MIDAIQQRRNSCLRSRLLCGGRAARRRRRGSLARTTADPALGFLSVETYGRRSTAVAATVLASHAEIAQGTSRMVVVVLVVLGCCIFGGNTGRIANLALARQRRPPSTSSPWRPGRRERAAVPLVLGKGRNAALRLRGGCRQVRLRRLGLKEGQASHGT